jgi:catechol 2,3-dioxygenase-like lactoylglutathione lyase family enzyme
MVGLTVEDMDRSLAFYTTVLAFEKISDVELSGEGLEQVTGVFGARVRSCRLRLGGETIELSEYLAPRGRPVPSDSRSNDLWFQHIAIITPDMDRAYAHLRRHRIRHASTGPQRLPDWNPGAGGIEAFYFHDPDAHVLEVLEFPPGKGDPRWPRLAAASPEALFLGIDHTAIVVADTEASLALYRDSLGMSVAGESENWGTEQAHLNNVFGARLRITSLRCREGGPAIELLEYLAPSGGRAYPGDARSNDLFHWQTTILVDDAGAAAAATQAAGGAWVSPGAVDVDGAQAGLAAAALVRDPDGHALLLASPK